MQKVKIKSIKKLSEVHDRHDLTVNTTANFFANGILIHNTSHRCCNVLVDRKLSVFERLLSYLGVKISVKEWLYLNGTRRVVIGESKGKQFHDPTIRDLALNLFKGNLRKGETIYLEIVGYEPSGTPIMGSVNLTKFEDKAFQKRYNNTGNGMMVYSYGCEVGKCDFYVYKITQTNEDGKSIDYLWDDVVKRCDELGVKHVIEIDRFTISEFKLRHNIDPTNERDFQDKLLEILDGYAEGSDVVDPTHIREGVCIRVESNLNLKVYKHKGPTFKIAEGLVKDSGVIDTEECN